MGNDKVTSKRIKLCLLRAKSRTAWGKERGQNEVTPAHKQLGQLGDTTSAEKGRDHMEAAGSGDRPQCVGHQMEGRMQDKSLAFMSLLPPLPNARLGSVIFQVPLARQQSGKEILGTPHVGLQDLPPCNRDMNIAA